MAEKRKSDRTVCVKIGAKMRFKMELFPAVQWPESAHLPGERFRVRINRRWHDGPEGEALFLDIFQISALACVLINGTEPALPHKPDVPKGARVSVPTGKTLAGEALYDGSRTYTEPMRGFDGRWYVNVITPSLGSVMAAVDTLKIHEGR